MRLGDVAGLGQHQRHRLLGRRDDVRLRRVDDHHATAGRLGDVDVVEADPGPPDHQEVGAGGQGLGVDLGGAAHDQRLRARQGGEQRRPVEAEADVGLHARRRQDGQRARRELLGDQHSSHGPPASQAPGRRDETGADRPHRHPRPRWPRPIRSTPSSTRTTSTTSDPPGRAGPARARGSSHAAVATTCAARVPDDGVGRRGDRRGHRSVRPRRLRTGAGDGLAGAGRRVDPRRRRHGRRHGLPPPPRRRAACQHREAGDGAHRCRAGPARDGGGDQPAGGRPAGQPRRPRRRPALAARGPPRRHARRVGERRRLRAGRGGRRVPRRVGDGSHRPRPPARPARRHLRRPGRPERGRGPPRRLQGQRLRPRRAGPGRAGPARPRRPRRHAAGDDHRARRRDARPHQPQQDAAALPRGHRGQAGLHGGRRQHARRRRPPRRPHDARRGAGRRGPLRLRHRPPRPRLRHAARLHPRRGRSSPPSWRSRRRRPGRPPDHPPRSRPPPRSLR